MKILSIIRAFTIWSSRHAFSYRMIWLVRLLMVFAAIYLPRYMHEYDVREKLIENSLTSFIEIEGIILREIDSSGSMHRYLLEDKELNSTIPLEIGSFYKGTGRVKNEEIATPRLEIDDVWLQEQLKTPIQELRAFVFRPIHTFRTNFTSRVYLRFYPESAELLLGLAIGKKPTPTSTLDLLLRQSGLMHIAVASGANIIIVSSIFHAVIKHFIPNKWSLISTQVWVLSYCILTGFDPSILRAFWMFTILSIAGFYGRKASGLLALLYSVLILLMIQPFLIYSVSFQLSVAATLGILLFHVNEASGAITSSEENVRRRVLDVGLDYLSITISSTLCVFPILLKTFGSYNLGGIVANVFWGWMIGPIQMGALLYGVSTLLPFKEIVYPLEVILWIATEVFVGSIRVLSPFLQIQVEGSALKPLSIAFYYGTLFLGYVLSLAVRRKKR